MDHKIHEKREFTDIRHLIEWSAEEYGERTAFSWSWGRVTRKVDYLALRDDVRALATELLFRGYAGKHAVLIGKLSYEWALVYYAVQLVGGVLVPLDRDWSAEELLETSLRADAAFLFADEDLRVKALYIGEKAELESGVCFLGTEEGEGLSALLSAGRKKYAADPERYHNIPIDPFRMSLLVFTSGTTGKGKGVMLSQNNYLSDLSDVIPYIDFRTKTVGVLPPHHTYGSSVLLIGHIMIGCEVYFSAGLRYVVKELKEQKPGHMILVPLYLETFYRRIHAALKEQKKEKLIYAMIAFSNGLRKIGIDLRKKLFAKVREAFGGELEMIVSGGAPINGEILSFFESIGIATLNGYGITECAPIIAFNRSRNVIPGSVGNVADIDHVRIDAPNAEGEGEILVTGPNVMLGYYKDEAATAEAIGEDGYFRTGDLGKLTRENVLYITGRKKNLIILSNGKNVYPEEIESEFVAVPGVQDIVVYEGQSRRGLEHNAIVAEIFPDKEYMEKNGIADAHAYFSPYIEEYNRATVPYKKIAVLKIRDEDFPKNTLRKIMRFKMDMTID